MAKAPYQYLTFWVLLAMACGVVAGHFFPEYSKQYEDISKGFTWSISLFIAPLIFLTITMGISAMGDLKRIGKVGGKALIYFEVVTTFALLIGIVVAYVLQPGAGVARPETAVDAQAVASVSELSPASQPSKTQEKIASYEQKSKQFSWWAFFKANLTLQVLLASLVLGSILSVSTYKTKVLKVLETVSKYVFRLMHIVMLFAPIGAFGGIAFSISAHGLSALWVLAKLMFSVYCTMAVFIFGALGLILRYYDIRLLSLLGFLKTELLVVLGTSSSESALPALMEKLQRMGCGKSVVGLVVPAGYSFNLDGTTIYLSMATLFLAQVYEVSLSWGQIATIIGVLMVTSKGAAGVTGAGFIVLASTLAAIKVIPLEGLALLIGVDRFYVRSAIDHQFHWQRGRHSVSCESRRRIRSRKDGSCLCPANIKVAIFHVATLARTWTT